MRLVFYASRSKPGSLVSVISDRNNMANKSRKYSYLIRYNHMDENRKKYRTMLLFQAVYHRNESLVQHLLREGGVRLNALAFQNSEKKQKDQSDSLLMFNAIRGDANITRRLIRAGCRPNRRTNATALHYALQFYRFDVAQELIRSRANVNVKVSGCSALLLAIHSTTRIDETLIGLENQSFAHRLGFVDNHWQSLHEFSRVRINYNALMRYKQGENVDVCLSTVKMLLDAKANVNLKDVYGYPPIHWAVYTGNLELMKLLIDAGANVNIQDSIGVTALHLAVLCCDQAMVRLLLSRGARVDAKTEKAGYTAFAWASLLNTYGSHEAIIKTLIRFGSDANERNTAWLMMIRKAINRIRKGPTLTYNIVGVIGEYVCEVGGWTARGDANLEDTLAEIKKIPRLKIIVEKCQAQLTAMRTDKVGDTLISYSSVLMEPLEAVTRFARNEEFVKGFEANDYQSIYPTYASRLKEKVDAAIGKHKRMEQVLNMLSKILGFADPSHAAFEIIFKYFTETDIDILLGIEEQVRTGYYCSMNFNSVIY